MAILLNLVKMNIFTSGYASQIMAQSYAKSQPLVTFSDAHNTHVGSP